MTYQDPYQQPQQPDPYQQQPQQQPYQYPQQPYSGQPYSGQPYPQYQQPGYPGYGMPMAAGGQTNTMAILALVFAFVFSPLGIVFGHIAKKQIRERNEQGEGLATAGLIIGYIFTALYVIGCAFYIIVIIAVASHPSTY